MATAKRGIKGAHIALPRGINVGGKNLLPMKALVKIFESVGCEEVRTYIQSGNVVYRCAESLARRVAALIAAAIRDKFGIDIPVVVRSAVDFEAVIAASPYLG